MRTTEAIFLGMQGTIECTGLLIERQKNHVEGLYSEHARNILGSNKRGKGKFARGRASADDCNTAMKLEVELTEKIEEADAETNLALLLINSKE